MPDVEGDAGDVLEKEEHKGGVLDKVIKESVDVVWGKRLLGEGRVGSAIWGAEREAEERGREGRAIERAPGREAVAKGIVWERIGLKLAWCGREEGEHVWVCEIDACSRVCRRGVWERGEERVKVHEVVAGDKGGDVGQVVDRVEPDPKPPRPRTLGGLGRVADALDVDKVGVRERRVVVRQHRRPLERRKVRERQVCRRERPEIKGQSTEGSSRIVCILQQLAQHRGSCRVDGEDLAKASSQADFGSKR